MSQMTRGRETASQRRVKDEGACVKMLREAAEVEERVVTMLGVGTVVNRDAVPCWCREALRWVIGERGALL